MPSWSNRFAKLLTASAALASLAGCAARQGIHAVYEERYRLFFIKDHLSAERLADVQLASRSLVPMASLNRSFDELTADGFRLKTVVPVGDEGGATKFVFTRLIPEGRLPTTAPMEFSGLYRYKPEEEGPAETYYIFDPVRDGYVVRLITQEGEEVSRTRWDGFKLKWRNGDFENSVTLSADGRSIVHTRTEFPEVREDITVTKLEAFRVADVD